MSTLTHYSFVRRLVLTCLVFITICFSSNLFSQEVAKNVTNFELKDEVIQKLYSADGPYSRFKPENEIISERKEAVKVFDNKNGTNTMLMSAGPMHFFEDGVWKTSSNEIIKNRGKNSQEYPYVNLHNTLKTFYGNTSVGIQIYKNKNEIAINKYKVESVKLYDVNKNELQTITKFDNGNPNLLNNGKISYNLTDGISYEVEQLTGKIKSQYVINKNLFSTYDSSKYIGFEEIITFNEEVSAASKVDDKNSGVTFVDKTGKEILNYSDAFYFTKEDENLLHHDEANYHIKKIDEKNYKIVLLVPVVWFQKSDSHYPLIVDPSLIYYPTNATYWTGFTVNSGTGTPPGSNDPMVVGFYDCAGCTDEDYRPYSKFDISGIPDNACINSATYWLYQYTWTNGGGNDGLTFDIGWANTDPVPNSWNTIYNALENPAERYYSWNVWGGIGACGGCNGGADYNEGLTGWHEMGINYALAKNRIQARLTTDYITLGADLTGHANDCGLCFGDETNWLRWYGYSNANRPQLQIDYQANNACADATTVTDGSVSFNTTCATQDQSAPSCGSGTFNQVWYKYTTGASAKTITVSTCNAASFDTRIAVYKGSCGSLTEVGCNDDGSGCSLTSTLTFNACPNTSYLIAVGGYNGAVGTGTLTISSSTVTNLSASAGAAETICYNTSSVLGGSPTASNGFGSYSYSWTGGSTTANPSVTLTSTATYTVTVTDAGGCTATASKTVTVRPQFTSGTISNTGQTICYGGDPGLIGSTTTASGGDNTITYKWQANGVDIGTFNSATYDPPAGLTATTTYTRFAKDGTCNTLFTSSANTWVVTVMSQLTPSASATLAQCANPTNPYADLSATAPGSGIAGVWSISSGSGSIVSASSSTTTITGLSTNATATQVQWTLYYTSAPACSTALASPISITPTSLANIGSVSLQSTGSPQYYNCRTCSVKDGNTYTYYDAVGKIIAKVVDPSGGGIEMGSTEVCTGYDYNANSVTPTLANVKSVTTNYADQQPYLPRYWSINPNTKTGQDVVVTLYFTQAEFNALKAKATGSAYEFNSSADLVVTKFDNGSGGTFTAPPNYPSTNASAKLIFPTITRYPNSLTGPDYAATFTVSSFSTFYIHPNRFPFAPLPVELVSFTGYADKDKNVLNWTTVSERNSDKFEIEKSTNGIGGWKYLGWQKAVGGNVQKAYTFYDNQPVVGNNYYRLRIVDNDGTFTYSNTINIPITEALVNGFVKIFPNPTSGTVNLQLQSTKSSITAIEITNVLGQVVSTREATLGVGVTSVTLDINYLPNGTYFVSFMDALGTKHQEKIIKQ